MQRCALVTGGTGQDAYYLTELLLARDYVVHVQSRQAQPKDSKSCGLHWYVGAATDWLFLTNLILSCSPREIYNLASISRPIESWDFPIETVSVNTLVTHHIFETIRNYNLDCHVFQATSSEIFGNSKVTPQNENTPYSPDTPYGISKLHAHLLCGAYRRRYGLHLSSGIMFNHESPRRPLRYVTQKIAHAAAALAIGLTETGELDENGMPIVLGSKVRVGNLDVSRDFGHARDHVECMYLMMQMDDADDYVIGTGESHSIRDLCEAAFRHVGLDYTEHVVVDQTLVRKIDSFYTAADSSKAKSRLGWSAKTSFVELVNEMVDERISLLLKSQPERHRQAHEHALRRL